MVHTFLGKGIPIIDLCALNLSPYDYSYSNAADDFLSLIHRVVSHDPLVFATPVYWYTMSSWMKIFWDRITDLLYHHKDLVQQLKGKRALLFVVSAGGKPQEFEAPLIKTFNYLGMVYKGCWDTVYPTGRHSIHNDKERESFLEQWTKILSV